MNNMILTNRVFQGCNAPGTRISGIIQPLTHSGCRIFLSCRLPSGPKFPTLRSTNDRH